MEKEYGYEDYNPYQAMQNVVDAFAGINQRMDAAERTVDESQYVIQDIQHTLELVPDLNDKQLLFYTRELIAALKQRRKAKTFMELGAFVQRLAKDDKRMIEQFEHNRMHLERKVAEIPNRKYEPKQQPGKLLEKIAADLDRTGNLRKKDTPPSS